MSESANSPLNFGGIVDPKFCSFEKSGIWILPVSYRETVSERAESGAAAIIEASQKLELYDEETDAEIYKLGIHTLGTFAPVSDSAEMMRKLHEFSAELLRAGKFVCTIGGEHSISVPLIETHAEKFYDLSVLQIDARPDLRDSSQTANNSKSSVMFRVVNELRIPSAQIGIRSISAEEARRLGENIPTKIFLARDIAGQTDWIEDALECLTENVYLTIDVSAFDPSIMTANVSEPGGLGWSAVTNFLSKLAAKKRIVGMDLVEFAPAEHQSASAFLCAKLIYKTLGYIFRRESPKLLSGNF